jgi:tetratricopeptide (TPR) repeat protein
MKRMLGMGILVGCLMGGIAARVAAQSRPFWDESSADWTYQPPPASQSVEIGNFYLRKKDYPGALSRFKEAVHSEPDYAPAYLGLGKVYDKMGLKQKALEAYEKYLEELPSAESAARAKKVHKAIERLKRELPPAEVKSAELAAKGLLSR